MLAGGKRKREREGGRLSFKRERARSALRSSRHPSYILEVSVADPLDLACLKRLPADISVQTDCRVP
jgi:hypothetical protein